MHELRWKALPLGLARFTPWGYLAACVCGWEQRGLAGTKQKARLEYAVHRAAWS